MGGRLQDRVAIVTGAARGLGRAIALRLAEEGARPVVADVNGDGAREAAAEIKKSTGCEVLALEVDVTDEGSVDRMVSDAVSACGRLDIMVANAGIVIAYAVSEFPEEEWRRVIDVNLVGYFLCARAAARVMEKQKSGVIIQVNSKSGKRGSFSNSAYTASKFGGIGLTQSLALEMAPHGVRVNAVCPGNLLDSPLWTEELYEKYSRRLGMPVEDVRNRYEGLVPMGRGATYDDVTGVVVFLASDESGYMTGQAVNVTGGQEMS